MTLDQFVAQWNGKYNNYDNNFGTQCKDLFSQYNKDVVGNPDYVWGNAWELYNNAPDEYYEKIINTPSFVPIAGDVCIWKQSFGGYGHVAVCLDGCTANKMRLFGQNYPKVSYQDSNGKWINGSPCQIVEMNYNKVHGFLRPKGIMENLTKEQARWGYRTLGRREPENEAVITGKGFGLLEQLAQSELEPYITGLNAKITELKNRPPEIKEVIKEVPVEKIVEVDRPLTEKDKEKIAKEYDLAHPTTETTTTWRQIWDLILKKLGKE